MQDLRGLSLSVACEISKSGYTHTSVPPILKSFCADELITVLPRCLSTKLFSVYAKNQCKFMEARFLNNSETEMIISFDPKSGEKHREKRGETKWPNRVHGETSENMQRNVETMEHPGRNAERMRIHSDESDSIPNFFNNTKLVQKSDTDARTCT